MSRLGKKLRKLRVQKDVSQRQLARHANVSNDYISKIELGQVENVGIVTLERIARALGVHRLELQDFHFPQSQSLKVRSLAKESYIPYGVKLDRETKQLLKLWFSVPKSKKKTVLDTAKKHAKL